MRNSYLIYTYFDSCFDDLEFVCEKVCLWNDSGMLVFDIGACLTLQDQQVDVLIIGAGPTGLGAAKRLHDLVCIRNIGAGKS